MIRNVMSLLVSVGVPLAVLFVMSLIEQFAEPLSLRQRSTKAGWDMCILAMGVTGGAFANDSVIGRFGQQPAIVIALLTFLAGLAAAALIAHLRRKHIDSIWASSSSIILGIAALGVPAYLVFTS